jgi:hypothetical protein
MSRGRRHHFIELDSEGLITVVRKHWNEVLFMNLWQNSRILREAMVIFMNMTYNLLIYLTSHRVFFLAQTSAYLRNHLNLLDFAHNLESF